MITGIEEVDKKRVRIYLEGGTSMVLYKGEVRRYSLKEGEELSEGIYEEIRSEILKKRACKRAMFLLERMDRTEAQLREKLRQNFYDEEMIEEAVSYVRKYHYLDDQRYAANYVRYHRERKSRRQIEMELRQKGIDRKKIERALEEEYPVEDDRKLIKTWIQKKHYSPENSDIKEKQRMYQFLLRKGFSSNDILHVLEDLT